VSAVAPLHEHAFDSLYREHRSQVYSYALTRLRNVHDAEDVTQTTFLNAFNAIERGQSPRLTEPWLIAIARNVCRQRFREAQRRPLLEPLDPERLEAYASESQATAVDIRTALMSLPSRQRTALVMRELEGRSNTEICQTLGLTDAALQALLVRARRSARELLEGRLTCKEARRAVKHQYGYLVSLDERRALMSHLRECPTCAAFAGHKRPPQKGRTRSLLGLLPFPNWLPSVFGGGSGASAGSAAGTAGAVAGKLLLIAATGTTVVGVTWGMEKVGVTTFTKHAPAPPATRHVRPHVHAAAALPPAHVTWSFASVRRSIPAAAPKAGVEEPKAIRAQTTSRAGLASLPVVASAPVAPAVSPATPAESPLASSDGVSTPATPDTSSANSQSSAAAPADSQSSPTAPADSQSSPTAPADETASSQTATDSQAATDPSTPASQSDATAGTVATPAAPPVDTGTAGGNGGSDSAPGSSQGRGVGPTGTPPGQADKAAKGHSPPGKNPAGTGSGSGN
jgi:RNA polymerase sigma factor (sigma-70 family)